MKCVIRTFTGKEVNPLDLQPDDICIEDIAHALACCNRFAGHARRPISVAQHSVNVSRLCTGTGHELQGLLHDGAEAFLGDITKWLKSTPELKGFRDAEDRAQRAIFERFGCCWTLAPEVEMADRIMVRYEGSQGFTNFRIDHPDYPPLTEEEIASIGAWAPWTWRGAEDVFLTTFRLLTGPWGNAGARARERGPAPLQGL